MYDHYWNNDGTYVQEKLYYGMHLLVLVFVFHKTKGPVETPKPDECLAKLVPGYHQWFGPSIR